MEIGFSWFFLLVRAAIHPFCPHGEDEIKLNVLL